MLTNEKQSHLLVLLRALLTWASISAQTSFTLFVYNTSSKIYCHFIMTWWCILLGSNTSCQPFFYWGNFTKKRISNFKNSKMKWIWRFPIAKFVMFGFECVAKDIEGWLLFCTSCLVYSQLWLNLSENDCHFWIQTKILKENTLHAPLFDYLYTPSITPQIVTLGTCLSSPLWHCLRDMYLPFQVQPRQLKLLKLCQPHPWNYNCDCK